MAAARFLLVVFNRFSIWSINRILEVLGQDLLPPNADRGAADPSGSHRILWRALPSGLG
jgi:hypothetical protein